MPCERACDARMNAILQNITKSQHDGVQCESKDANEKEHKRNVNVVFEEFSHRLYCLNEMYGQRNYIYNCGCVCVCIKTTA